MKVAVFSARQYDKTFLFKASEAVNIHFNFFECPLEPHTVSLAAGHDAINCFVNDDLSEPVLTALDALEIRHISLRCAGFNNVDLQVANSLGMTVSRVPAYSPEAVAEHTIALMLGLNRKLHKAYNRVKENNFALDGLLGFNINGKTIGVIGTGKIGLAVIRILKGFGADVLCFDPSESEEVTDLGASYASLEQLFKDSDIITLHCPLNQKTQHLINAQNIARMKDGVVLLNTSRGGLIDTKAIIAALKTKKVSGLGLDVYEMESELFFQDRSSEIIQDDVFQRLLTFPNVIITGHQGFFTEEALTEIAQTTIANLVNFETSEIAPQNRVAIS